MSQGVINIRITQKSHQLLTKMAKATGGRLTDTLEALLEAERRRQFFETLDRAYGEAQTREQAAQETAKG